MKKNLPNIVIVICHDLGQQLGCYGVDYVRSDHIDDFADSAIRFAHSFCAAPQCSPSRSTLYTGRFPHANGVVGLTHDGFANDLKPGEVHLAQILKQFGYQTHLFGIQHESSSSERCGYEYIYPEGRCDQVADDFVDFMARKAEARRPFFAQVGFFEPHRPFPHEGIQPLPHDKVSIPPYLLDIPVVREDLADMEASTVAVDRAFGRILESIRNSKFVDETIIVFTVDHGIAFPHAKMTLYDPGINVALILSIPGLPGGIVYKEMISNADLMPTLLELVGIPIPDNLHGRSFRNLLIGEKYQANPAVFAEKTYHTYYDPMCAIRTPEWKLIANFENAPWQETSPDYENNAKGYVEVSKALDVPYEVQYHPPFELFNLMDDPFETRNLAKDPAYQETRDELAVQLRDWMEKTQDPLLAGPMAQGAYVERMRWFKALGMQDRLDLCEKANPSSA